MTFSKFFLFFGNKILPFIGLPILAWLWTGVGGAAFAWFVLGLPFLFGYIAPGIGTNILKMWRFRDSWTIGGYFIHHGFIYASTMGLVMYVAFFPPAAQNDWGTLLGNMARGAGILGFVGWTHDLIAIRAGLMEVYNQEWKRGAAPEVIAAQYAPLSFCLLGACYAGLVTLGYQSVVLENNLASLGWLFPLGLAILSASISLPFLPWIREVLREMKRK
ncbi:MAG: hypothetical protein CVU44_21960 [Chloroflexi bacterium HGW-Chloroflexi-6]|nr:MAG: hypothetical protein CVU44_21960 [Chloroflexi bacterium HGW-Chloroflexi-6]